MFGVGGGRRGWAPRNPRGRDGLGALVTGRGGHAAAVNQRPVGPIRRTKSASDCFASGCTTGFAIDSPSCCWIVSGLCDLTQPPESREVHPFSRFQGTRRVLEKKAPCIAQANTVRARKCTRHAFPVSTGVADRPSSRVWPSSAVPHSTYPNRVIHNNQRNGCFPCSAVFRYPPYVSSNLPGCTANDLMSGSHLHQVSSDECQSGNSSFFNPINEQGGGNGGLISACSRLYPARMNRAESGTPFGFGSALCGLIPSRWISDPQTALTRPGD